MENRTKEMERRYESTTPKQFGDLHQRMRFLKEEVWEHRTSIPPSVWHAIWDLETEVKSHEPINPPRGKKRVSTMRCSK